MASFWFEEFDYKRLGKESTRTPFTVARRLRKMVGESGRAILTSAIMLDYLGNKPASEAIEKAVRESLFDNETTRDLGGNLSTNRRARRFVGD